MKKNVSYRKTHIANTRILDTFLNFFWHVPHDVLLRAVEANFWKDLVFIHPVLDVGTGDGKMSKLLYPRIAIDFGIDSDSYSVAEANKCGVYKKVILGDATKMPFKNSSFETVISNSTFEHIRDDKKAIEEVGRVLKKGGRFILTVPTSYFNTYLKEEGVDRKNLKKCNDRLEHFHLHSLKEWRKILGENNIKINNFKYYFSEKELLVWYRLYQIATFKPYERELWSYLKDSPYGKLAPKRLIIKFLNIYLRGHFRNAFKTKGRGAWVFMEAQKV